MDDIPASEVVELYTDIYPAPTIKVLLVRCQMGMPEGNLFTMT